MAQGNCGSCRHWQRHCHHRRVVGNDGQCWGQYKENGEPDVCVPGDTGVCVRGEMGAEHGHPADETSLMWGQDGSDYRADVYTKINFGCVMYGAKG